MRIWDDYWLLHTQPLRPYDPPTELTANWTVSELISNRTKYCDHEKVRKILPEMADHIFTIKPSKCGAPDKRAWLGTDSGSYFTKSGYHSDISAPNPVDNQSPGTEEVNWIREIWSVKTLSKI